MHADWRTAFLSLWLAHLVCDFPLQTESILNAKRRLQPAGFLTHGILHFAVASISLVAFAGTALIGIASALTIAALVAVHLASDFAECRFRPGRVDSTRWLLLDQTWHAATVAAAAFFLIPGDVNAVSHAFRAAQPKLLPALVIYVAVVFGGGYVVRNLTKPLLESFESPVTSAAAEEIKELRNAGMYIGWLERFLVLSALLLQSPATIGLILTAKSIVRFPELKDLRFAEYFLIGTLLSISIALVGGLILVQVVYGSLSMK